jgi:adenosine deaminase
MDNLYEVPEWLKNMPKTDLHCHMGGSIRLETILDLAREYHVNIHAKNVEELKKAVVHSINYKDGTNNSIDTGDADTDKKSLKKYLAGIHLCESVMKGPEAFERVTYEIAEDAKKENVRILELRFGPTNYETPEMPLFMIVESALKGLYRASEDFDMYARLIICGIRTDMDATRKAAEIAVNYKRKGVVGFDMAGKENGYRAGLFVDALKRVRYNFLPITIHAGEEDGVESISEAVADLRAVRIGHGLTLRDNQDLLEFVDKTRLCIEMCPTSNINTGAVESYGTHPIRTYLQDNLRVTVNTDNRTISDTTITNEYMQLMRYAGLTQKDILKTVNNGIKASFLNSKTTRKLLNELGEYVKKLGYESLESIQDI